MKDGVSFERLREVLHYDPDMGVFIWLVTEGRRMKAGKLAGHYGDLYVRIKIDGEMYKAHRLAHFYMTGSWPPADMDHRDLNRHNNRWSNLRPASRSQNCANQGLRKDNVSGHKGVCLDRGKWSAQIQVNRKHKCLGRFDTKEEAIAVYLAALPETFGEFARAA